MGAQGPAGAPGAQGPAGPAGSGAPLTKSSLYSVQAQGTSNGPSVIALCATTKDILLNGGCAYGAPEFVGSLPLNAADPTSQSGWECSVSAAVVIQVTAYATCITVP